MLETDGFAERLAACVDGDRRCVGVEDEAVVNEGIGCGQVDGLLGSDAGEGGDGAGGDGGVVDGEVGVCGEGGDCAGDVGTGGDVPVAEVRRGM